MIRNTTMHKVFWRRAWLGKERIRERYLTLVLCESLLEVNNGRGAQQFNSDIWGKRDYSVCSSNLPYSVSPPFYSCYHFIWTLVIKWIRQRSGYCYGTTPSSATLLCSVVVVSTTDTRPVNYPTVSMFSSVCVLSKICFTFATEFSPRVTFCFARFKLRPSPTTTTTALMVFQGQTHTERLGEYTYASVEEW